jgi:hypothetical protein
VPQLEGGYTPEIWTYDYPEGADVRPFGDDTTYRMGLGWLYEDCDDVQDWGCGPAYGRRLCPPGKSYLGVDGSPTSAGLADVVCELTAWHPDPKPQGVFMRHVLEHNEFNWEEILDHALGTFQRRLALVVFTPFTSGPTKRLRPPGDPYTDLALNYGDLTGHLSRFEWRTEALPTGTQYGSETVFYVRHPRL